MAFTASAALDRRQFRWAVAIWGCMALTFTTLLLPVFPLALRESVSGLGLLVAGVAGTISAVLRARRSVGIHRRPWARLALAGFVAIAGNLWVVISGADPITSPSLISNVTIAMALVISTIGLLAFPSARRRGAELLVMFLDGLVAGGAFLLIASVLVYSELLDAPTDDGTSARAFALIFPVLDVVLATVAVLLVVRASRADRLMLVLVATGFLLYAASDLAFAVQTAQGSFHFGTLLDVGWILGYLTMGLAAWTPMRRNQELEEVAGLSDALGTSLVFGVLIVAAVVQLMFGLDGELQVAQSVLWVILVGAAALRQIMLTADNSALRRGLERRVEEQTAGLRRLARQNEVLITSVGDGVYGVDADGRVTFVNPSAAAALGYATTDLEGRPAHETFHAPQEDGTPFPWSGCYIHEAIANGVLASAEEDEYVRADGSSFPVEITASPLMDESEVRGAVVVFRDVTQRREVDRMKNEFLSVVSHELRTPLTSIRGSLGLLAGGRLGELPERAASLVSVAVQNSERLTRLINDLLDIERMESGVAPMDLSAREAGELLEAAADQIEGMATSLGVRVQIGDADGRVLADEDRIIQTLMNLVGNAIKFSEPGSTVRLDARPDGPDVHFRVIDEGRGIPADKLDSIFDRFEQVDSSDSRQKGGTGLGLTISRGIVERQGGRIWVESELGVGTTVHFTLPAALRASADLTQARPGAPVVLVCDDDQGVVDNFCTLLRAHGYHPIGVTEGARVPGLARSEQPQAVLLDLKMPGTTGSQVLAALGGSASTRDIPVVVISGLGPEADEAVARSTDDWLIKPVSEQRLVQAVSMAVSGHQPGGSVLLVEDDEELAGVIALMLSDVGLDVVHASGATQAVVRGEELRPAVIVLDVRLPDGDGGDVVAEFRRRGTLANTPLVVYSAADVDQARRDELQLGTTVFLTKGRTSPEQLRDQVLGLIDAVTTERDLAGTGGAADGSSTRRTVAEHRV
jgi:PAS domain S-box-containing protein